MRKDMSKVIVERPRSGRAAAGLRAGRTRALTDDDGEPIRAKGAREPAKSRAEKTKRLNETINPLKRYLASMSAARASMLATSASFRRRR